MSAPKAEPACGRWAQVPARAIDDNALRPPALRVLVALGTYGNRDGWCYPAVSTIAQRLGMRRQSVSRQIGELKRLGYLTVQPQMRPDGSQSSNLYRIICDVDLAADRDRLADNGGCSATLQGVQHKAAAPNRTTHTNLKSIQSKESEVEGLFARFWQAYPSRGSASNPRKPAYDLFCKKVGMGADPERIIAGAVALAARRAQAIAEDPKEKPQFTQQAKTWLNQEGWEDALAGAASSPAPSGRVWSIAEYADFLKANGLQGASQSIVRAKLRELGLEARWPVSK